MQRVPMAEFSPELRKRLETLWGEPPNLYRALANQPALAASRMIDALAVELDPGVRDYSPGLP